MLHIRQVTFISCVLAVALLLSACQPLLVTEEMAPADEPATPSGQIWEVAPTGDPAQDVTNVQATIDGAQDGDTVLLKAGVFEFGDWKTNPIPGGFIVINKGVTVMGDGYDDDGNPKTVVHGGSFRAKGHWEHGEFGVFNFGGDATGAVVDGIWFQEPHHYALFASGFSGLHHKDITVRNVTVTDVSAEIPEWAQDSAVGRSIDMGANVPAWDMSGPSGTIIIENCTISDQGSALDMDFVDPDTGTLYYTDSEGNPLSAETSQGFHAIGLWINMSADFIVRNNTIRGQHEGIVMECMAGSGNILVEGNDIEIETTGLALNLQRGLRLTTCFAEEFPFGNTRTVRVENNRIKVVASDAPSVATDGMILSNDNGLEGFEAQFVVTNNEIEMAGGNAGIVMGSEIPPAILRNAEISDNVLAGSADYGVVSTEGARLCQVLNNDMTGLTAEVADVGLYGEACEQNLIRGVAGKVDIGDGAGRNEVIR